ncbi:hypothetical protein [cyanobacterium endosymbiont of Epithemia turgida]|nr:hypothetical protein [cyanobacterium endosymbiont of Epithemia turgida]
MINNCKIVVITGGCACPTKLDKGDLEQIKFKTVTSDAMTSILRL